MVTILKTNVYSTDKLTPYRALKRKDFRPLEKKDLRYGHSTGRP